MINVGYNETGIILIYVEELEILGITVSKQHEVNLRVQLQGEEFDAWFKVNFNNITVGNMPAKNMILDRVKVVRNREEVHAFYKGIDL